MIPTLPLDVLRIVLEALDDRMSLTNCCLASKIILNISRPLLYYKVEIVVKGTPRLPASSKQGLKPRMFGETRETLRAMQENPSLAALVHTVQISTIASTAGSEDPSWSFNLQKVLKGFPELKTLFLVDTLELDGFDTTIAKLQCAEASALTVHVKHWYPRVTSPLTAAYKSLEIESNRLTLKSPFTPISAGITSLKVICGRFFDTDLTLAAFTNLRHLEFYSDHLPARKSTPPFTGPPNRYEAILVELQHLKTLKKIVLSEAGGVCVDLLRKLGFIASIPPSVVTLSLDRSVDTALLLEVVQSLPPSTGLKTLESRSTWADLSEIQEECDKRGIRLALF